MTGPNKYNLANMVQEEDGSFTVAWIEGSTIYWSNNKSEISGKVDVDLPCLISAIYDQHPILFAKFEKKGSEDICYCTN